MKNTGFAVLAGMFLACAMAAAPAAAQEQQQKAAPKEHSMTGCLQKGEAPNTFQLTNVEGGKVQMVDIPETTANLAPHVTHKVAVTGSVVPGKEGVHTMKITAVKMISATCP